MTERCPTCWSTSCVAGEEFAPGQHYGHDWANGPMAPAHERWKDERTPPASYEEAQVRGLIEPETDQSETDNSTTAETDRTRPCGACTTPFESKRSDARFCSPACRLKAHRRDVPALAIKTGT